MYYVCETAVREAVTQDDVMEVIQAAFMSLAAGGARNFPVVREELGQADGIFGLKSGFCREQQTLGVKVGGLWPGNKARGLANHQSTIILFAPDTGLPTALVRGTYLTALRTAAASALSIRALARPDAETLGIVGAGGQSLYQVHAAIRERDFRSVYIYDVDQANANALCSALKGYGYDALLAEPEVLAAKADVIVTVTPSRDPIIRSTWVRPGTHLACMGADTRGKQEVETDLVVRATLFGDEPAQAVSIGECQHAYREGRIDLKDIVTLGRVLAGDHPGRINAEAITLFDSTGIALQDLAAAELAFHRAEELGLAVKLVAERTASRSAV